MRLPLAARVLVLAIAAPASAVDRRTEPPRAAGHAAAAEAPAARIAATAACESLPGWECGSLEVPIDRAHPALGTTELSYGTRLPARITAMTNTLARVSRRG